MSHAAHLVWIIGAIIAIWGITVLFKPDWMKHLMATFEKRKFLIYFTAGIKIIIGVVFLILATKCKWPWVIIILGIMTAGGSIIFCMLPYDKIKAFMTWWENRPIWLYRVWAVLATLLGGFIMYAGVPK